MRCNLGEFNALEILTPTEQVDGYLVSIKAPFTYPQVGNSRHQLSKLMGTSLKAPSV